MIPETSAGDGKSVEIPPMAHVARAATFGFWGIAFIALLIRAWAPMSWPVFCDEAVYTIHAERMATEPCREAILDSAQPQALKPPLLFFFRMWLRDVGSNPLVGGRWMSAVCGAVTAALCVLLGKRLGGWGVGLAAGALYAIS